MRITNKIFNDLAIYMVLLGIGIGLAFPFFCLALGVPSQVALTPTFFLSCIVAGILLSFLNITLARKTVGSRIGLVSGKMKQIERLLKDKRDGISEDGCESEDCMITVDSEDELGECARSFNSLVMTLSEVLELNSEIQRFSEMLTSHLEIDALSREALNQLILNTGAVGGALLIEKSGELALKAAVSIREPELLEENRRLLSMMNSYDRQVIRLPADVIMDAVIADFRPQELIVEPITYKNSLLGVLILANNEPFGDQVVSKLDFFNRELSLAFRNAITHEQMRLFAAVDTLTGLYNRRFGVRRVNEEFGRAIRYNMPLSLLMFDIDHFKTVNDTYGHMTGDKVLASVARVASSSIREGDVLLRYGGEEFLCALPGASLSDATMIGERIRNMVMDSHLDFAEQVIRVTVSIGAVDYPRDYISSSDQMIGLADEAMYAAKNAGRNRVVAG